MKLVTIKNLKKYYGDRLILDIDKFEIEEKEKIGIVGENGVGKTTLLKGFGKINLWEQIIIDRGPAGYLFFDSLYQRTTEERELNYKKDLKLITENPSMWCAIYLTCDPLDVIERHKLAKEDIPLPSQIKFSNVDNVNKKVNCNIFDESALINKIHWLNLIMSEYERYFDDCYANIPTLKLNTSIDSLEMTMKKSAEFIDIVKEAI